MIQEKGFYYNSKKIEINLDREKVFVVTSMSVDIKKFLQSWIQTENQYKSAEIFFKINEKVLFIKELFQKNFAEILMILPEYGINPGAFYASNVFLSHVTEQQFILSDKTREIKIRYSDMPLVNLQRLIDSNTKEDFYFQQSSYNRYSFFVKFRRDITKEVMKKVVGKNLFKQKETDYAYYLKAPKYRKMIEKEGDKLLKKIQDSTEDIVTYVKSLIIKEYLFNCADFDFNNTFFVIKIKRTRKELLPFESLKIKIDLNSKQVEVFLNEKKYCDFAVKKFNDISGVSKNDLTDMFFKNLLLKIMQGPKND